MHQDIQRCIDVISDASQGEITPEQAKSLVDRIVNEVNRPTSALDSAEKRIREIGTKIVEQDRLQSAIQRRNALLTVIAQTKITTYAKKFSTSGEGLIAFMNGSNKVKSEGRLSVYYQGKAMENKYVGRLVEGLTKSGAMTEFKTGQLDRQVFQELFELGRENGKPGISGSLKAQSIAKIVRDISVEMIDRENRAGAFINTMEGYIMRQSHDADEIRRAGGVGFGPGSKEASFQAWSQFIAPLLDERTFDGVEDRAKFLRDTHEAIITGVHDKPIDAEVNVNAAFKNTGALAKKVSSSRLIHFKDADSAFAYNQKFGMKDFRESTLRQIQMRARAISMLENFGPNPERTFDRIVRDMKTAAKKSDDDVRQLHSLEDWRVQASFKELMGFNDVPVNPSLSRISNSVRAIQNMAKLGGATITSFADKAFFQSEMGFQGMDALRTIGKQFTSVAGGRPEGERRSMLNLMGAAMDGFTHSLMHRFSAHDNRAGTLFKLQSKFFDINGMNWWNDVHKSAAAELMSSHLAEHAHLSTEQLPEALRNTLKLYGIEGSVWDAARKTVTEVEGNKYITPDGMLQLSREDIGKLVAADGDKVTDNSVQRMRDRLDTQLRTYFADRVDIAVPTPGNEEKTYAHWNTQAGTPLGEAVRMLMMFRSMPIAVFKKVVQREIYGHGSETVLDWLSKDTMGKFRMLQLISMATAGGYVAGMVKDALKGRTPKDPTNIKTIQDAMLRGGGLGIYGDLLFTEYDRSLRSFTSQAAGPVLGQVDTLADLMSQAKQGKMSKSSAGKLVTDNTPFINLFYIRPVLDYFILWNLQEMSDPGSLRRQERKLQRDNGQGFFIRPSENIR